MKLKRITFGWRFVKGYPLDQIETLPVKSLLDSKNLKINFVWPSFDFGFERRDIFGDGDTIINMFHLGPIIFIDWRSYN
jgi:hypothetical protein